MISELNDDDILNFLMTSEFENNHSPNELKYLLFKWRYFYRLLHTRSERNISDLEFKLKSLEDFIKTSEKINEDTKTNLLTNIADRDNEINSLKNRKLTWRERWSGVIITKKEETKNEN